MVKKFIEAVKFDAKGLVPVVVQDYKSKKVLMLAYMNKESLKLSFETKQATYFSRSRQRLWKKGETSGNVQNILKMNLDCDGDTILLEVEQIGVACHTGTPTCFSKSIILNNSEEDTFSLEILYNTIEERKRDPKVGSYTNYLFEKGIDKILKKVGEECAEVIIASKNSDISELQYELSDLVYHCIVLMVEKGLTLEAIQEELKKRMK